MHMGTILILEKLLLRIGRGNVNIRNRAKKILIL